MLARIFRCFRRPTWITCSLFLVVGLGCGPSATQKKDVSSDPLLAAAQAGGEYLSRCVKPDGSFVYRYDPYLDEEGSDYNLPRHAGTVYAMYELYGETRDPALHQSGQKAVTWLLNHIYPLPGNDRLAVAVDDDDGPTKRVVKLGSNALAVLAICQYTQATGDRQYLPVAKRLAEWICAVQDKDGWFSIHKQSYPAGEVSSFRSEYYPGEAILALLRLHALDPDPRYLDAADRGAQHLIRVRDKIVAVPDHWLLYALNELYRLRPREMFLDHAMRLSREILPKQHGHGATTAAWVGGWYDPPRTTPTSTRVEGLCAAWRLARDYDRPDDAEDIAGGVALAVDFIRSMQFGEGSDPKVRNPSRAAGGIRSGIRKPTIRIDYVQHFMSAVLSARAVLQSYEAATDSLTSPRS